MSAACVAFTGAMTSPSLGSRLPEPDPRSDRRAMTLSGFGISLSTQTPRAVVESAWCAVASRVVSRGVEVGPAALARAPRAIYRVVEQLVARRAHIPEVAGSSPARATSQNQKANAARNESARSIRHPARSHHFADHAVLRLRAFAGASTALQPRTVRAGAQHGRLSSARTREKRRFAQAARGEGLFRARSSLATNNNATERVRALAGMTLLLPLFPESRRRCTPRAGRRTLFTPRRSA